ncbi:2-oxoglutarate-Fe(II) type oxidoreductase-like isoform X1 [Chenopodium quinoa]|uniref:2-oxoglutarate-Fe(II) type oxidoreductase-like isoform X1 n=1 Tax=Chenopodium quinoa TaxID=63459 RepID=UPI000B799D44|nr:2-oxoglutarate-Fe(II) type oxidoreductase-like isoform X1 [Chenopodium quinoa]
MGEVNLIANLPIIDLSATDRFSTAATLRQACIEVGFFYIVNHGVDKALFERLFDESKKFFSLPEEEKMKLDRKKELSGYTALYSEKLDTSLNTKGDPKESFYIGPLHDEICNLNQWPSEELLPNWRPTMEAYHRQILSAGNSLLSLLALALNLDEKFFENVGALDPPMPFLRLLHYPEGDPSCHNDEVLGASAHSDYGMITLLATDGVPGLQVCRERDRQPQIWENVPHVEGAIIVNIGDITERWTNGLFRSTLHRVVPKGRERYSAALFLDPPHDFSVECLETCCSESNPPRFPRFATVTTSKNATGLHMELRSPLANHLRTRTLKNKCWLFWGVQVWSYGVCLTTINV